MKIILLRDVPKIGHKYDVKEVTDGYARNFLIAQKLAERATPALLAHAEKLRATHAISLARQKENALKAVGDIRGKKITITRATNEKGGLFASIGREDIHAILADEGFTAFTPDNIILIAPIKKIGEHPISVAVEKEKGEFILAVIKKDA